MSVLKILLVVFTIVIGAGLGGYFDKIIGFKVAKNISIWVVIAHNTAFGIYALAIYFIVSWNIG